MTSSRQWSAEDGWRQLELASTVPTQGEFRVFDTMLHTVQGAVFLALDASGLRHVLVPVADDFQAVHDRRSGGVHLTTHPLVDAAGQRQFLDFACQKQHLNSVFTHLADEVLAALCDNSDRPFQTCRETLQRWRELLDREMPTILSTEALCGLFGELWHLARVAEIDPQGISAWQGPHGARHDFTVAGCALEVKTTIRRDEWKFRVHGLKQLEKPGDAALYLCAMRLELNGASGTTVPDILQQMLQAGVDRRDLLGRLSLAGYDMRDEGHYRQFRFDVIDLRTYEVAGSFPRLIEPSFGPEGVPAGVSDIHYTIDLAVSPTPPLQANALGRVHAALAGVRDADTSEPAV
ncbi:MAG: PD-(D/E)XK motif protein [Acidiferrobacteraceae bacterium]